MEKPGKELISLSEFSKEIGVNKSKLLYYASIGIFIPVLVVGKTQVFEKVTLIKRLKEVERLKKNGKTLFEIVEELGS